MKKSCIILLCVGMQLHASDRSHKENNNNGFYLKVGLAAGFCVAAYGATKYYQNNREEINAKLGNIQHQINDVIRGQFGLELGQQRIEHEVAGVRESQEMLAVGQERLRKELAHHAQDQAQRLADLSKQLLQLQGDVTGVQRSVERAHTTLSVHGERLDHIMASEASILAIVKEIKAEQQQQSDHLQQLLSSMKSVATQQALAKLEDELKTVMANYAESTQKSLSTLACKMADKQAFELLKADILQQQEKRFADICQQLSALATRDDLRACKDELVEHVGNRVQQEIAAEFSRQRAGVRSEHRGLPALAMISVAS